MESAVFLAREGYYADAIEEAAALLEVLVQNHSFMGKENRTAIVCCHNSPSASGQVFEVNDREDERFLLDHRGKGTLRLAAIENGLQAQPKPLCVFSGPIIAFPSYSSECICDFIKAYEDQSCAENRI
jgi:hypothetical protein